MKARVAAALAIVLSFAVPASAHRLDEYLQATILSVEGNRVEVSMRLVPGVAVSSAVIAGIDTNGDGVISAAEQQAYAKRVLRDVTLSVDGYRLEPQLSSVKFPSIEEMKEGLGEILIEFTADLPREAGNRKLIFENHHQSGIAAYLVNCLVPRDKTFRLRRSIAMRASSFMKWITRSRAIFRLRTVPSPV